jgi:integrase
MKNVNLVGNTYWLRKQIPPELRGDFGGQVEIRRSLGTKDKREAEKRLHRELTKINAQFDQFRKEQSAEAQEARDYVRQIAADLGDYELAGKLGSGQFQSAAVNVLLSRDKPPRNEAEIDSIIQEAAKGQREMTAVEAVAEAIQLIRITRQEYERDGVNLVTLDHDNEPTAPIPLYLVDDVERHLIKLLKQEEDRFTALHAKLTGKSVAPSGSSLSSLLESYKVIHKLGPRTILEFNTAIKRFEEVNGPLEPGEITLEHGRKLKEDMFKDGKRSGTVKKQISCIKSLLNYATDNGLLERNPLDRLKVERVRDQEQREPFLSDELKKIFGGLDQGSDHWWACRIALYTGMRCGEICQLQEGDFVREADIWCIRVTDEETAEGRERALKNPGSFRLLPIHRTLIADGLIDFLPIKGQLLKSIRPDAAGRAGGLLSKWFTRFKRDLGITSSRKVFHSFRHTFITAAREAMPEEWYTKASGQSDGGKVARTYGVYSIKTLREYIDRISFETS